MDGREHIFMGRAVTTSSTSAGNTSTSTSTRNVSGGTKKPGSGPVERKPRADAVRNRERVLRAAAEVFAERGFDATLNDVAARAGCGIGTVYRHFPNKEALIEDLFVVRLEEILALAEQANEFKDPWKGLLFFLEGAMELQVSDRGLRDSLLHSEYGRTHVSRSRDRINPVVGQLVTRAKESGRLRDDFDVWDVPMLVSMIGSVADYVGCADPELWKRYLNLMIDGLVQRRSTKTPLGKPPTLKIVEQVMTGPR
jgi:AcrR family transcriptional regulator